MMKFRVLIISDDSASVKVMQNILRHHRLLVSDEVKGGDAAILRISNEEPYHILLCDLAGGKPGSIDVMRVAKARSPDTKMIVITGFGDHQLVIDAIKAGVYGYLHKPFRPEELNLVLNNLTNHFSQWSRLELLTSEIAQMENDAQEKIFHIQELEKEVRTLRKDLLKYEPGPESNDLQSAMAQAAARRTNVSRGYNVFQELTNLNHLLDEKKISAEEYTQIRRTVLEKAYQVPTT